MMALVLRWGRGTSLTWPDLGRPCALVAAVCLWIATLGNIALWRELAHLGPWHGLSGWMLVGGMAAGIGGLMALWFSMFCWRWTLKPMLVLMLLAAAGSSHFMLSYGVVIDPSMMVNAMQTDVHEAADLLCMRLLLDLLVLGALPAILVIRQRVKYGSSLHRVRTNLQLAAAAMLLVLMATMVCFQPLASTMRNHREVRYLMNPLNVLYALGKTAWAGPSRSHEIQPIGLDAVAGPRFNGIRPPLLVLVLGETGRAGNFGINGYARDTTPQLQQEDVVSFRNAWSCGTSTAASVPCMFSRMPRKKFFDRDHEEEGLLDVLQRAGYGVLWLDNQGGCKGVCDRVPNASTCADGDCLDGVMLDGLDERLAALPAERRAKGVVLVLHQIGSHGPAYYRRSSPATKRFLPECRQNELQACSRAELVNAYDNSISYTDRMLGDTIRWLQHHEAAWQPAMLYVADHGESLGENNLYLHGLPYAVAPDVQKRVPWITWLSAGFEQQSGLNRMCLRGRLDAEITHDHYFHSVLGLLGVRTSVYDAGLDAYAACRDSAA